MVFRCFQQGNKETAIIERYTAKTIKIIDVKIIGFVDVVVEISIC